MTDETMKARAEVAQAWRKAWEADGETDAPFGLGPPPACEGCSMPATCTDGSDDNVPLCDACGRRLEVEWQAQAVALLREGADVVEALPSPGGESAARALRWLERVRLLVEVTP